MEFKTGILFNFNNDRYPKAKLYGMGISLGANFMTNYAATEN